MTEEELLNTQGLRAVAIETEVKVPGLPRYEADLADLAKVIRGEKAFEWPPAHDFAVQETILRASGMPVA